VPVEAEIRAGHGFGGGDDLSGVAGEVLDHVVDGFEHRHLVILRADVAKQLLRRQPLQDLAGFADGLIEHRRQLLLAGAAARCEFRVALAHVGRASDAVNDPLAHVARRCRQRLAIELDASRRAARAASRPVAPDRRECGRCTAAAWRWRIRERPVRR
jgi:hypothetical protein